MISFIMIIAATVTLLAVLWIVARVVDSWNRVRYSGSTVELYGEKIHYRDSADRGINAEATPVVLIHGSTGNLWDMEYRLAPALQAKGFRTISIDRPGIGLSSRKDSALSDPRLQAPFLDDVLDYLCVGKIVLLGYSLGNAVVMEMALNHPERIKAAVNVAGVSHPWIGAELMIFKIVKWPIIGFIWTQIIVPIIGPIILGMVLKKLSATEYLPKGFIEKTGLKHILKPQCFKAHSEDLKATQTAIIEMYGNYRDITVPFLMAWGEREYFAGAEKEQPGVVVPWWSQGALLKKTLSDCEVVVAPRVGHWVHHFGSKVIADALRAFLTKRGLQ